MLYNGGCAMLNGGKLSCFLWNNLQAKAANIATLLENNLIMRSRHLNPFQHFLGKENVF